MTRELPQRRNVGEAIPHSEWAKDNKRAARGSAGLAWRVANAIENHARRHRLTVLDAMNELLYNKELK
jgi:hypothetical protein